METFKNIVDALGDVIWNLEIPGIGAPWLVCLLLGTGLFLTVRMGMIQAKRLGHAVRIVKGDFDDPSHAGDISHFQALTTALSATVGIGNVAGVALAIHFGGPGAIFWMWVCAALGMCTKYVEVSLAMKHRDFDEAGNSSGGPQKYIVKGLGNAWKPLAFFFAFCAICSSLGAGNMNQINTLAQAVNDNWQVPDWVTGIVAAILVGAVILGGIKRIGRVTSILAPAMAIMYVAGALIVLVMNASEVPGAFGTIVSHAFNPQAGFAGTAAGAWSVTLLWGVKRGLFSNEAGQGSAPIAHAAAKTDVPLREGLVALLEPFIDTIVICTMTALVIITANVWDQPIEETHGFEDKNLEVWTWPADGDAADTLAAFGTAMGRRDADAAIEQAGYDGPPDGDTEGAEAVEEILVIENGRPTAIEHAGGERTRAVLVKHDGPLLFLEPEHVIFTVDDEGNRGTPFTGRLKVDGGSIVKKQHSWIQQGPELATADGSWVVLGVEAKMIKNGQALTAEAFRRSLGDAGMLIVTITVLLFALSTAISWSYYGDRCTEFLFGIRGVIFYKLVFLVFVFLGAILPLKTVWDAGDVALGMMTVPNLIAVLFLSRQVRRMQDDYFSQEHVPIKKK